MQRVAVGLVHCYRLSKSSRFSVAKRVASLQRAKEKNERTAGFETARIRPAFHQRPPLSRVDAVEKAKSGHPGAPLGCAPIAYLLYHKLMKHDPSDPKWIDRDRFVLSNGHGVGAALWCAASFGI